MPRLGGTINNNYSSFWLTKGDYLRLKNLEIGYTSGKRVLTKLGVRVSDSIWQELICLLSLPWTIMILKTEYRFP